MHEHVEDEEPFDAQTLASADEKQLEKYNEMLKDQEETLPENEDMNESNPQEPQEESDDMEIDNEESKKMELEKKTLENNEEPLNPKSTQGFFFFF